MIHSAPIPFSFPPFPLCFFKMSLTDMHEKAKASEKVSDVDVSSSNDYNDIETAKGGSGTLKRQLKNRHIAMIRYG